MKTLLNIFLTVKSKIFYDEKFLGYTKPFIKTIGIFLLTVRFVKSSDRTNIQIIRTNGIRKIPPWKTPTRKIPTHQIPPWRILPRKISTHQIPIPPWRISPGKFPPGIFPPIFLNILIFHYYYRYP